MTESPRRAVAWLLSWGAPVVVGFLYFVASFPGMTHGDSLARWQIAHRVVSEPGPVEITNWFSPVLIIVRVWALESGMGYAGYHALYCLLTFGTWALLVATLLREPWRRACAHLLLVLPFVGGNLAWQAADVVVATGLALILVSVSRQVSDSAKPTPGLSTGLYFAGCLIAIAGRQNTWLILPVLIALPLLVPRRTPLPFRLAGAAAPVVAVLLVSSLGSAWPIRDDMKPEVYASFEIIGMWKLASRHHPDQRPPALFSLLPERADYYLARWDPSDGDELIWYTPSLRDRAFYRPPNRDRIRRDYIDTIRRFPASFLELRLLMMRNGLGYTEPREDAVGWLFPEDWKYETWMPAPGRAVGQEVSLAVRDAREATRGLWEPLISPWAWWLVYVALLSVRLVQRRADAVDATLLWLVMTYHATIVFTAPVFCPRYAFPVWTLLGVGSVRLLVQGARPPGQRRHRGANVGRAIA